MYFYIQSVTYLVVHVHSKGSGANNTGTPGSAVLPRAGAPETTVLPQTGGFIVDARGEERCGTCQAPPAAQIIMEELEHRADELELQSAATKKRPQEEDANMLTVLTASQANM